MTIESKKGYPSISRQCELLGVSRSGHYRRASALPSARQLESERVKAMIDCKRVQRLMREMGLQAICPKPNTNKPHPDHRIYPYLLGNVAIERMDQVWFTDIAYIPMVSGTISTP